MRNLALRFRYAMSTQANVFAKYNQFRQVTRFEAQNVTWAVQQIETHSNAVARGLKSLGVSKGDTVLLRIPQQLQTQIVATQLGAEKLGVKLQRSSANDEDGVVQELQKTNAAGLIFDPAHIGEKFNKSLQLNKVKNGEQLSVSKLPKLKFLVQTGSYSMRGVYKFKNILNYAPEAYSSVKFEDLKALQIPQGTEPIIVTDIFSDYGIRGGLLNALYNNRFVIYAHPNADNFNILTANIPKAYVIGNNIKELPSSYIKLENKLPKTQTRTQKQENKEEKRGQNTEKPAKKPTKEVSTQTKNDDN